MTRDGKAVAYARRAYSKLYNGKCPGGEDHEVKGLPGAPEYCAGCIREALAEAFEDGMKWREQ